MIKKILVPFLFNIILFLVSVPLYSQELTASEIYQKVNDAVVVVISFDANGKFLCQDSGVVIDNNGLILTNFHLLCGGDKIGIFQNSKLIGYPKIEAADFESDIMVLKMDDHSLIKIETANSNKVIVGEKIYAIGSPLGYENTISDGIVSGLRNINNRSLIQITADISEGSSGGAVLNSKGELIAISKYQNSSGQNLNFAVPINDALNFIKEYYLNPDDTEAKLLLFKGGYAFISDDFNKALTFLNDYIKLRPESADGYITRGLCYGEMEEYRNALKDFNKAIELDPLNENSYITRGRLNGILESYDLALKDYNMAIKLNGNNPLSYKGRGLVYISTQNYKNALEDFSKSIEINNSDAQSYYLRAIVYFRINEFTGSINDLSKAVELTPDFSEAYFSRALSYYKLNELDKAIKDYKKCIEIFPDDPFAYNNLGWVYIDKTDYLTAISSFKKSYELDKKHWNALLGIALSYYSMDDNENAKKYYDLSCDTEPALYKGMEGIRRMEKEGFIFSPNQIKMLKKMFGDIL